MLLRLILMTTICLSGVLFACDSHQDIEDASGAMATDDHGFDGLDNPGQYDNGDLEWRDATLTWFESYPDLGSEECLESDACENAGYMELFEGQMTEEWIENTLITAVHSTDFEVYGGHILRLRQGNSQMDVMVYDSCRDEDCDGCCTAAVEQTGFLIDLEIHTFDKFGGHEGIIEWACVDC